MIGDGFISVKKGKSEFHRLTLNLMDKNCNVIVAL